MTSPTAPASIPPASPHQIRYLRDLAQQRALFGTTVTVEQTIARVEEQIDGGLSRTDASALLHQAFRARPHPTAAAPVPLRSIAGIDSLTVPEGCYAVLVDDTLRFYRIYIPSTGEHEGVEVIRRFASENLLALYPDEIVAALRLIDADPDSAAFRFADEYTRCYVCTRVLTDAVSRLLSVGPHCRGFATHHGLRQAAADVDRDPTRRGVYRALRIWALQRGFVDPRSRAQRAQMAGQMTAARVASAWSGLPGILHHQPEQAVALVEQALAGTLPDPVRQMLLSAAPDTAVDLVASGVLSAPVLTVLGEHRSAKVRQAAQEFFLSLLGA
jgi:hypothetical protein